MTNEMIACRLCGGVTEHKFSLRVLNKYDVGYWSCNSCLSLQTDDPFWLSETYGGTLPNLDTGAARRALRTCAITLLAAKVLRVPMTARLLDFGGGDGLTCRLLRDSGIDAYVYDKYVNNFYADGYSGNPNANYEIICAIELLEHLRQPALEIGHIFSNYPEIVIISTELYKAQGSDWAYLGPAHGGHVFFYSMQALKLLAERHNYTLFMQNNTAIFARGQPPRWQRILLSLILRPEVLLGGRIWMQTIRPRRR